MFMNNLFILCCLISFIKSETTSESNAYTSKVQNSDNSTTSLTTLNGTVNSKTTTVKKPVNTNIMKNAEKLYTSGTRSTINVEGEKKATNGTQDKIKKVPAPEVGENKATDETQDKAKKVPASEVGEKKATDETQDKAKKVPASEVGKKKATDETQDKIKKVPASEVGEKKATDETQDKIKKVPASEVGEKKATDETQDKIKKVPASEVGEKKATDETHKKSNELAASNTNQYVPNDSSNSHFMVIFFFGLLFTIVGYVVFQKRKKIIAYVIEGRRRNSRDRRVSGNKDSKVSYKPLDTDDKEAGINNYKYVY